MVVMYQNNMLNVTYAKLHKKMKAVLNFHIDTGVVHQYFSNRPEIQ